MTRISVFRQGFLLLLASLVASLAPAQEHGATLTFRFDRPGLEVPSYVFTIHEDGSGSYEAPASSRTSNAAEPPSSSEAALASVGAPRQTRVLALAPGSTAKLFEQARGAELSRRSCASKAKNIADTGAKVLIYDGKEGIGSCSFNYTENKNVIALTQSFQAMANTLEFGQRLERLHRFDRLGLDQETQRLVDAVKDGRAVEVKLIAPTLESLSKDPQLLERVKLRAATLLSLADATP